MRSQIFNVPSAAADTRVLEEIVDRLTSEVCPVRMCRVVPSRRDQIRTVQSTAPEHVCCLSGSITTAYTE